MKNKILSILSVLLLTTFVVGCSKVKEEKKQEESKQETKEDVKKEEVKKEETKEEDIFKDRSKKVGSGKYGYLQIPKDFYDFKEIAPSPDAVATPEQWSSADGYNVITLLTLTADKTQYPAEAQSLPETEIIGSNYYAINKKNGAEVIAGKAEENGRINGRYIRSIYPNGKHFIIVIFNDSKEDTSRVRVVSVEGTKENVSKLFSVVDTWKAE